MKHNTNTGRTDNNGFTFELYTASTATNLMICSNYDDFINVLANETPLLITGTSQNEINKYLVSQKENGYIDGATQTAENVCVYMGFNVNGGRIENGSAYDYILVQHEHDLNDCTTLSIHFKGSFQYDHQIKRVMGVLMNGGAY